MEKRIREIITSLAQNLWSQDKSCIDVIRLDAITQAQIMIGFMVNEGVVELILNLITMHPQSHRIVMFGASIIARLTLSNIEARKRFTAARGEETILAVLDHFRKDYEIPQMVAILFSNVMCPHGAYKYRTPFTSEVIRSVVESARQTPSNAILGASTMIVLANAACNNHRNQILVRTSGGIAAVVECMTRYRNGTVIQQKGCFALGNISGDSPENRAEIGRVGGIHAIVNAMRAHPESVVLQDYAIYAVGNTCCNCRSNSVLFNKLGGIEVALEAFRRFKNDTSYLSYAPNGFGNLAGDSRENKLKMCSLGLIDLLTEAIDTNRHSMNICRSCARAIEFLLACDDIHDKWINFHVKSVVEAALGRHPDCLGLKNAMYSLMRKKHPLVEEALREGVCTRAKVFCKMPCPSNTKNYYCPKCCVPQYTYHCLTCYEKYSQCVRLCEVCYKAHPKDHVFMKVFMSRRCTNEPIYTEGLINVRSLCAQNGFNMDSDDEHSDDGSSDDSSSDEDEGIEDDEDDEM